MAGVSAIYIANSLSKQLDIKINDKGIEDQN